MRTCGIICEYNPFHTGHKYQLDTVKKTFDSVVCVMSGSFVQRGSVSVFDKWTRAKAALLSGCDLVLELPAKNVLSSAEGFAYGGVYTLSSLGIVDSICFGSECGDINALTHCAEAMLNEPPLASQKIRELTALGFSYVSALSTAYEGIIDTAVLSSPNNILGIEYIKTLKKTGSSITPITHKREGSGYHDTEISGGFASATQLRAMLKAGEDISAFTPYDFKGSEQYDTNRLTDIFKYKLIKEGRDAFFGIQDVEAGLDNRFLKALDKNSISEIIEAVKTKRYTYARLSRIVASVLLGIKGGIYTPEYVRVLGMNDTGKKLLSEMRDSCTLPIVNKVADFCGNALDTDILATNLAALCTDKPIPQNRDFLISPVIMKY